MYAKIRLLSGYKKPLLYKIPESWLHENPKNFLHNLVRVPIRTKKSIGLIDEIIPEKPSSSFIIKELLHKEQFPYDPLYHSFISNLSSYYQIDHLHFYQRLHEFIKHSQLHKETSCSTIVGPSSRTQLTDAQQHVVNFVQQRSAHPEFCPILLHGVTGSGKTEVYKKIIEHYIEKHKSIILLLPEVSLAVQFAHLLAHQLPSHICIKSFHSAANAQQKKELWHNALHNIPMVIIGVHMPVMLPLQNLGTIIVDEEHEAGYQEKKHPKINSKEAALMRAQHYKIPILLGSATPSISSFYNVEHKKWHFFELKERFAGIFPAAQIVNLADKKKRPYFWISDQLKKALEQQLLKRQQTILFLNRRGYSFFVQCKTCSFIFSCHQCSVSLTLHNDNTLSCHYCDYKQLLPLACPSCKADKKSLLKKGIGTQQLVSILQKLLPDARIGRADMDTTTNKKIWQQTINDFTKGNLDIIVGTQTITKGYHFPNVTLVGVIWADLNLHFPMYNAAETTLQQLIQVAGRAGRDGKSSKVIIQTLTEHPIFSYLNEIDYRKFFNYELEKRSLTQYPPLIRLAEIELKHNDPGMIEYESHQLFNELEMITKQKNLVVQLLGPALPPVHTIKNWHRRKIYIKSKNVATLLKLYDTIDKINYQSQLFFTPNPLN